MSGVWEERLDLNILHEILSGAVNNINCLQRFMASSLQQFAGGEWVFYEEFFLLTWLVLINVDVVHVTTVCPVFITFSYSLIHSAAIWLITQCTSLLYDVRKSPRESGDAYFTIPCKIPAAKTLANESWWMGDRLLF